MITMWSVVIVYIYDIAAARVGNLRTGTSAYEWVINDMRGGVAPQPSGIVPQ